MDEEYFVRPEPVTPLEKLDLAPLLHERQSLPGWVKGLSAAGYLLFAAGLLTLVALPVLAVVAFFRFLDSLPW